MALPSAASSTAVEKKAADKIRVTADEVEVVPRGYKRAFLKCRALGHSWHHYSDVVTHSTWSWVRGLSSICESCGTVRVRWLTRDGRRWGLSYAYPDGYQLKRGDGTKGTLEGPVPAALDWRRKFVSNLDFGEEVAPIKRPAGFRGK